MCDFVLLTASLAPPDSTYFYLSVYLSYPAMFAKVHETKQKAETKLSPFSSFNISRSLQAKQQELARHKATDDLKKNLEKRLDRDTLVERMYYLPLTIPLQSYTRFFVWRF